MTLHYGSPFSAPGIAFSMLPFLPEAERTEREKWTRWCGGETPDLVWRIEAVSYSACSIDQFGGENYYSTDPRLELFGIPVVRWTEHGATVNHAGRTWTDLREGNKQWASLTPADALKEFAERRRRQIYILERKLRRARLELGLTNLSGELANAV